LDKKIKKDQQSVKVVKNAGRHTPGEPHGKSANRRKREGRKEGSNASMPEKKKGEKKEDAGNERQKNQVDRNVIKVLHGSSRRGGTSSV